MNGVSDAFCDTIPRNEGRQQTESSEKACEKIIEEEGVQSGNGRSTVDGDVVV